MKEFVTAVREESEETTDDAMVFKHDDREVRFYQPSTGQMAMMLSMARRDMDARTAGTFISLFFEMMDEDTERYFEGRLLDRKDTFDLNSEGGIFDIFEYLAEEWSGGRPTKQPTDFQPPRRATGKRSTGTTRAKGSTSSRSRSRASSR